MIKKTCSTRLGGGGLMHTNSFSWKRGGYSTVVTEDVGDVVVGYYKES